MRARDERRAGKGGCMGMCARARSCVWMRVDPRRRQHACVIGARPHVHEHAPAGSAHMPAHLFHAGPRPLSACVRYGVCVCVRARARARVCACVRSCPAPVSFVKKERKGNFRKKEKQPAADDEPEAEDVSKKILETKLEHKMRSRVVGVQSDKLAVNPVRSLCTGARTRRAHGAQQRLADSARVHAPGVLPSASAPVCADAQTRRRAGARACVRMRRPVRRECGSRPAALHARQRPAKLVPSFTAA